VCQIIELEQHGKTPHAEIGIDKKIATLELAVKVYDAESSCCDLRDSQHFPSVQNDVAMDLIDTLLTAVIRQTGTGTYTRTPNIQYNDGCQ